MSESRLREERGRLLLGPVQWRTHLAHHKVIYKAKVSKEGPEARPSFMSLIRCSIMEINFNLTIKRTCLLWRQL